MVGMILACRTFELGEDPDVPGCFVVGCRCGWRTGGWPTRRLALEALGRHVLEGDRGPGRAEGRASERAWP